MVDTVNPTTQFHPYQPETSTPASERTSMGGLGGILKKIGLDSSRISNTDGQLNKARTMARDNSGLVLGGLAALAIGAGLMRRRGIRTR